MSNESVPDENTKSLEREQLSSDSRQILALNPLPAASVIKPWTKSQGPIYAKSRLLVQATQLARLLSMPVDILPSVELPEVKPFCIGLGLELKLRLKSEIALEALDRAIRKYVWSLDYLLAVAQPGAMRHDIDGHPVEAVSETDRYSAQNAWMSRIAKVRGRRSQAEVTMIKEEPPDL